jgi:hypothetical protein
MKFSTGIKTRVDLSLRPKPPLPDSDYLDCLLTVREKLFALQIMLQEFSSAEQYRKNICLSAEEILQADIKTRMDASSDELVLSADADTIAADVHECIKDAVAKLLDDYLKDYFEKEFSLVRIRLVDLIRKGTKDETFVMKMSGLAALEHPPRLRYEKFKSIDMVSMFTSIIKPCK